MAVGTRSHTHDPPNPERRPEISVCESAPGTAVFLEAGNTDGWIASDTTTEVTQ